MEPITPLEKKYAKSHTQVVIEEIKEEVDPPYDHDGNMIMS